MPLTTFGSIYHWTGFSFSLTNDEDISNGVHYSHHTRSIAYVAAGADNLVDPLTITASTASLVATPCKIVKQLYDLHGTLKDAPLLLHSIASECQVVSTALAVLQDLYIRGRHTSRLLSDQISSTLEISLTGCAFILSALEKDVQDCLKAGKDPQMRMPSNDVR